MTRQIIKTMGGVPLELKPRKGKYKAMSKNAVAKVLKEYFETISTLPLEANHPRHALIGRVVAEFAQLEHELDRIIWEQLNAGQEAGSCVTAQIIGAGPRFRVIIALTQTMGLPETIAKSATLLMNKVQNLSNERNRIVHDPWFGRKHSKNPRQFKSRTPVKKPQFGLVPVKRSEVLALITTTIERTKQIRTLRGEILSALVASGKRPPQPDPLFLAQLGQAARTSTELQAQHRPRRGLF